MHIWMSLSSAKCYQRHCSVFAGMNLGIVTHSIAMRWQRLPAEGNWAPFGTLRFSGCWRDSPDSWCRLVGFLPKVLWELWAPPNVDEESIPTALPFSDLMSPFLALPMTLIWTGNTELWSFLQHLRCRGCPASPSAAALWGSNSTLNPAMYVPAPCC